jgi:DNA anti-recombination protein RmuC
MAKSKLEHAARKIGAAMGKADRQAHVTVKKVQKAGGVAKSELESIVKQVESLKKQLAKSTKKLKKALA